MSTVHWCIHSVVIERWHNLWISIFNPLFEWLNFIIISLLKKMMQETHKHHSLLDSHHINATYNTCFQYCIQSKQVVLCSHMAKLQLKVLQFDGSCRHIQDISCRHIHTTSTIHCYTPLWSQLVKFWKTNLHRVSHSGRGAPPLFYDFLDPPIKTNAPHLKLEPFPTDKQPSPLKSEAPFQEIILRKTPYKAIAINTFQS